MNARTARSALAAAALSLAGCSGIPSITDIEAIDGPQFGTDGILFQPVSSVMEARCGTLDCHGQMSRPMRIFGQQGLRMPLAKPPPGYETAGSAGTTPDELLANYAAMVGLEPEITIEVFRAQEKPTKLTLVRKPRLDERHKGGRIWNENDPGDQCLILWLTSHKPFDTTECTLELQHL